ncbi:MAG TPA: 6-pyruvoyl-tetrahydropterin synthase-related protein [Acidobacteriaceae bacterium]|nr:6-pyruvoyl-tetrahydropterin synthase-related protein [Acidobacteriaceae bacterium]
MRFWFQFPATPSSDATRTQRRRSLLLAVALVAVLPLAWRFSCGQDFTFHLQNWLEVVDHARHGLLWPHWAASANYLAGEPRFVFYPPLSWLLGGLLGAILPWSWTPIAFTLLALLGAGFSFRAMARAWMPEDSTAIAACLYVVNPYMLFVVYERAALAELLAATWIPLLVLFALRTGAASSRRNFLLLALTVAALWLTNAPAAVMGSYTLGVVVAAAALRQKSWRIVARSAGAYPLGLGLAGFWLIPAIYEQRWVEIRRSIGPLMRVEDSFLFRYVPLTAATADERFDTIYHNGVLRTASWIAVVLVAGCVVAALGPRLQARRRPQTALPGEKTEPATLGPSGSGLRAPLLVLGLFILFLLFSWSDPLWRHLPELRYLQFPWRWLLVLGLVFAALAGLALRREQATRRAIARRGVVVLLFACGMALLSSFLFWQPCDDQDNVAAQIAAFHSTGFEGTDEYTPAAAHNDAVQQNLPPIRVLNSVDAEEPSDFDNPPWTPDPSQQISAQIRIERWSPERCVASIATAAPGYAVLRLMDYPAWQVTLNGSALRARPHRIDGLLVVPIAAGTTRIDIRWRITPDQAAGIALSLVALAITLALAWKGRRSFDGNRFR